MHIEWRAPILLVSCALAAPSLQHRSPEPAPTPEATADRAWTELTSSMERMHSAMSGVAPSGDADVDFVRLMLPHHQAAIDMAKTELLAGKSPTLRRLAQEIIADQQSEIDLMELWLKKHAPGRSAPGDGDEKSSHGASR